MATPETQNSRTVNSEPAATIRADAAGVEVRDWFSEFERLEKIFFIITGILAAGTLVAYLGYWIGSSVIAITGLVIFSLAMMGIASLAYPLIRITIRALSSPRRQRSAEGDHQV